MAWAGPSPAEWGGASAPPRRWPARWSAPPSARRSRSPACCWPGRARTRWSPDTSGAGLGGRPAGAAGPVAVAGRDAGPARPGAAYRPVAPWAHWITPEIEARRYDTAVLRRRAAPGSAPATSAASRTRWRGSARPTPSAPRTVVRCRCFRRPLADADRTGRDYSGSAVLGAERRMRPADPGAGAPGTARLVIVPEACPRTVA